MPQFEMPLEAMRSYQGRNPKPADFDAYWERAIHELDSVPAAPELVPHANPARFAECFDLWFTGVAALAYTPSTSDLATLGSTPRS